MGYNYYHFFDLDKMTVRHRSSNSSPSPVVHLTNQSCSSTSHSLNGDQTEKCKAINQYNGAAGNTHLSVSV